MPKTRTNPEENEKLETTRRSSGGRKSTTHQEQMTDEQELKFVNVVRKYLPPMRTIRRNEEEENNVEKFQTRRRRSRKKPTTTTTHQYQHQTNPTVTNHGGEEPKFVDMERQQQQQQQQRQRQRQNLPDAVAEEAATIWISPEFVQEIHNGQTQILSPPTATTPIAATAPSILEVGNESRRDEEDRGEEQPESDSHANFITSTKHRRWMKWVALVICIITTIIIVLVGSLYVQPNNGPDDPTYTPTTTTSPTTPTSFCENCTTYLESSDDLPLGYLTIVWAGTIDNAEGDDRGLGRFRYFVLESNAYTPAGGFDASATFRTAGTILPGDSSVDKWSDGGERSYNPPLHIYDWTMPDETKIVFVYEDADDCEYSDWCFPEWNDDPVFVAHINRQDLTGTSNGIYQLTIASPIASPYAANDAAIQNAISWINRDDVQAAIGVAWDSGDLSGGRLPKMVIEFGYSYD